MHNIYNLEKYIRSILGIVLIFFSNGNFTILTVMGLFLLFTVISGHCPMYKLFNINCSLAQKNDFISNLPKNNPEPVFVFSKKGFVVYQNEASKKILPNIKKFIDISDKNPNEVLENDISTTIKIEQNDQTYLLEVKGVSKDDYIMAYGFNATEIENSRKELKKQIITDHLTNLGNGGKLIKDSLQHKEKRHVLVQVDIIKFGQINSFFSPEKANELLIVFANTLQSFKTEFPFIHDIYRLRANTFAFLLFFDDMKNEKYKNEIVNLEKKIFELFENNKLRVDDIEANINIRMGIASNEHFKTSYDTKMCLLEAADMALSEAKEKSLHVVNFEDIKDIKEKHKENLVWANKLHDITHDRSDAKFKTYFQPIYNLKSQKIEKFESLIRIEEGDKVISPFFFLDIAKQTNILPKITKNVLKEACEKFANTEYEFSINITAQDFLERDFVKNFENSVKKYNIAPSSIVLEILEDEDMYTFIETISALKELGFKIAIDDFGTGYSNFQKLQQLNVDYIKIDGSLVKNVANNPKDLSIINSICTYAKTIGVKTIAEFVADKEIFDIIKNSGVDYAQGYYISEPTKNIEINFND